MLMCIPNEKWTLFNTVPTLKKITGQLDTVIIDQLHKDNLIHYMKRKHNIHSETLEQIDLLSLQHYLKAQ